MNRYRSGRLESGRTAQLGHSHGVRSALGWLPFNLAARVPAKLRPQPDPPSPRDAARTVRSSRNSARSSSSSARRSDADPGGGAGLSQRRSASSWPAAVSASASVTP
jgi:hypothetical protein